MYCVEFGQDTRREVWVCCMSCKKLAHFTCIKLHAQRIKDYQSNLLSNIPTPTLNLPSHNIWMIWIWMIRCHCKFKFCFFLIVLMFFEQTTRCTTFLITLMFSLHTSINASQSSGIFPTVLIF
jgi:hypothetical protein